MAIIALFFITYFIGSIPFGLILTKLAGYGDIREIGSGNTGATNVLRTGNRTLAAITLMLDALKGAVLILIIVRYGASDSAVYENFSYMVALAIGFFTVFGHCFPVWLKFKGGKGVATTFGVLLAAVPFAGLAACVAWIVSAFVFRISSLAALAATLVALIVTFSVYGIDAGVIQFALTALVWFRHKDNIKRLIKGEEPKIKLKAKTS